MGNDRGAKAGGLLILSAVILAIGPVLTFVTVTGPGVDESFTGYSSALDGEGMGYAVIGALIGLMGILMFPIKGSVGRKVLGVIAILASLFALYGAVTDLGGESSNGLEASAGIGVWIVLLGALVGVVGSILALTAPGEAKAGAPPGNRPMGTPPQAGPPPTTTPPPS